MWVKWSGPKMGGGAAAPPPLPLLCLRPCQGATTKFLQQEIRPPCSITYFYCLLFQFHYFQHINSIGQIKCQFHGGFLQAADVHCKFWRVTHIHKHRRCDSIFWSDDEFMNNLTIIKRNKKNLPPCMRANMRFSSWMLPMLWASISA